MNHVMTGETIARALDTYNQNAKTYHWDRVDYHDWRILARFAEKYYRDPIKFMCTDVGGGDSDCGFQVPDDEFWAILPNHFVNVLLGKLSTITTNKEEMNTMNVPAMNFDFGPAPARTVAISPYGLAISDKNGKWFTYDGNKVIDVTGFVFNMDNMIYKVPAAVKDLEPGDMVYHKGAIMYIENVEDGEVIAIDILDSERKSILPVSNMFGFDFVTRIVSFVDLDTAEPDADNPFGNIMPFMMMQSLFSNNNGDTWNPLSGNSNGEMDLGKMMMMSAFFGGGKNPFAKMFNFGRKD